MLNLAKTSTLQAPLPYWMNKHQDRKCLGSWASLNQSFAFLMKILSYPKAWALDNIIISFDRSNMGFFLTQFFPLFCLRSWGTTKILSYERLALQEGTLHSALRTTGTASARFPECSHIKSPSQDHMQDLNSHLWCCMFLHFLSWGDSGPPKHRVCRHLPTQHSRHSPVFWAWERLLTAVGEMLESKLSRDPSFLQSSTCSS